MQLYDKKIESALSYLSDPDILHPTGDKPICYVTYDVEDAMVINRMIDTDLIPQAKYHGFMDYKIVSVGKIILDYILEHDYREFWIDESKENKLLQSIGQEIRDSELLSNGILAIQNEMKDSAHPLLIMKDLELIHPYDKIGRVEQVIYNQIEIPMLILYPGSTQGSNARTFLNIYPMDGSYRSKNF